jgi:hypothetical protein
LKWFETDSDFSNWKPNSFKLIGIFPNQTFLNGLGSVQTKFESVWNQTLATLGSRLMVHATGVTGVGAQCVSGHSILSHYVTLLVCLRSILSCLRCVSVPLTGLLLV